MKLDNQTEIIFHENALEKLKRVIKKFNVEKILLFTGKNAMKDTGTTERVLNMLVDYKTYTFTQIEPNPSFETIEKALMYAITKKVEFVIGLGGGSVLDVGKAVAILMNNYKNANNNLYNKIIINKKGLPFVAIPTTSGSSSELTAISVITDKINMQKKFLSSKYMYPDVAIMDPLLTLSLDKNNTAYSGLDVLSHALEAYWAVSSTNESDKHAIKAMILANEFLIKAYKNPNNITYRKKMMQANLESGKAILWTKTTLPHAISYPITLFYHIPHGFACALTLPTFLEFNYEVSSKNCQDTRGALYTKKKLEKLAGILKYNDVYSLSARIKCIIRGMGLPICLKEAGINNIEKIIGYGLMQERVKNNPRSIQLNELKKILTK